MCEHVTCTCTPSVIHARTACFNEAQHQPCQPLLTCSASLDYDCAGTRTSGIKVVCVAWLLHLTLQALYNLWYTQATGTVKVAPKQTG